MLIFKDGSGFQVFPAESKEPHFVVGAQVAERIKSGAKWRINETLDGVEFFTTEETEKLQFEKNATAARKVRDDRLKETDVYLLPDYPMTPEKLELIKAYRQALREWPETEGFPQIDMLPEKPL